MNPFGNPRQNATMKANAWDGEIDATPLLDLFANPDRVKGLAHVIGAPIITRREAWRHYTTGEYTHVFVVKADGKARWIKGRCIQTDVKRGMALFHEPNCPTLNGPDDKGERWVNGAKVLHIIADGRLHYVCDAAAKPATT